MYSILTYLRGFLYSFTSVLFVTKFPLITLKTAWESVETVYMKEGGIWEFGSWGGEGKDCIVDSEGSTPAVFYTQYNWFVWILPLSLPYTLLFTGGAVKQRKKQKDQKLNIWREKKQNENTSAASILNNGKVVSAPDREIAERVGLCYVRKGFWRIFQSQQHIHICSHPPLALRDYVLS